MRATHARAYYGTPVAVKCTSPLSPPQEKSAACRMRVYSQGDGGNRNRGRRDAITGTGHDKRCSHGRVIGRATAVACKYYNTHLIELACILVRFITCSNQASPTFKSHRLSTHTMHECQALTEATTLKKQIATEYQAVLPDTLPDHASLNLKIDKQ